MISTGSIVGEIVVDQEMIPEPARHPDAVLTVSLEDGELLDATYEAAETDRRTEQVRDRFEQLSQRLSSDEEYAEPSE